MRAVLLALLLSSAAGALVKLLLILLRPVTKRWFSCRWQYRMQGVVLFFLLGGGLLALPLLPAQPSAQAESLALTGTWSAAVAAVGPADGAPAAHGPAAAGPAPAALAELAERMTPLAFAVWLSGACLFWGRGLYAYFSFRRRLDKTAALGMCGGAPLPVVVHPVVRTPMLVGVLRPVIYIPQDAADALPLVLRHELTHWKNGDVPLKFLALFVCGLHWFNPLAHRTRRDMETLCELACDEALIVRMNAAERRRYGLLILDTASRRLEQGGALASGLSGPQKHLERRLSNIMQGAKKKGWIVGLSAVAALAVVAVGVTLFSLLHQQTPILASEKVSSQSQSDAVKPAQSNRSVRVEKDSSAKEERSGVADLSSEADGRQPAAELNAERPEGDASALLGPPARPELPFTPTAPVETPEISCGFDSYRNHGGVDFVGPEGSDIYAVAGGEVIEATADYAIGYGYYVAIDHGNGFVTLYSQCKELLVQKGDKVEQGAVIATMGKTGNASGVHLHCELRDGDRRLDLADYLDLT